MNISIIGSGYVGLVSGTCLADRGHQVLCVDREPEKISAINSGIPPIYEEGLEDLLKKNINKRIKATTDLHGSVRDSDITIIAVGTPFDGNNIDLRQIKEVSSQVGMALKENDDYHVVIVKSTVVPGTTDDVVTPILEEASGKKSGFDFGVGMNPEFLTEGQAIRDFMNPDRIVLGANDERAIQYLERLYESFENVPKLKTNNKTAEMIKYASNAMLATQISFSNELSRLCTALGDVDIVDVLHGVHLSLYLSPTAKDGSRVQAPISSFLEAGCGFGGSCLPKDVNALIAHGRKMRVPMPLLSAVLEINQDQPRLVIKMLKKHLEPLKGVRISILGLSFKPDTDDMRESPAITIINDLLEHGAIVKAYDPVANNEARKHFPPHDLELSETLEEALKDVDAVVLVTRWEQFREVPDLLARVNPKAVFVDGRRMLDKHLFTNYEGIGL